MDPFSAVGAASAVMQMSQTVASVTKKLYIFIKAARNVDEATQTLHDEVIALQKTLGTLESLQSTMDSSLFSALDKNISEQDSSNIWGSANVAIQNCTRTVEKLDESLIQVYADSTGLSSRVVKTVRFLMKGKDIEHFRRQIQSHTSMLHMITQMVTLRITCSTPGVLLDQLLPRIEELKDIMRQIYGPAGQRASFSVDGQANDAETLFQSAKMVIDTAESTASVISLSEANHSVNGEALHASKRHTITEWLDSPTNGAVSPTALSRRIDPLETDPWIVSSPDRAPEEAEDEFDTNMAERFLQTGTQLYRGQKYREALGYLRKGLRRAIKVPSLYKRPALFAEIGIKIAACHLHCGQAEDAESCLLRLNEDHQTFAAANGHSMDASDIWFELEHMLGVVLLCQGKHETAIDFATRAVKHRRQHFGPDNAAQFRSIHVLAQIYEAAGELEEARMHYEMIPVEVGVLSKISEDYPMYLHEMMAAKPPAALDQVPASPFLMPSPILGPMSSRSPSHQPTPQRPSSKLSTRASSVASSEDGLPSRRPSWMSGIFSTRRRRSSVLTAGTDSLSGESMSRMQAAAVVALSEKQKGSFLAYLKDEEDENERQPMIQRGFPGLC